jgi:hypothetical protein
LLHDPHGGLEVAPLLEEDADHVVVQLSRRLKAVVENEEALLERHVVGDGKALPVGSARSLPPARTERERDRAGLMICLRNRGVMRLWTKSFGIILL